MTRYTYLDKFNNVEEKQLFQVGDLVVTWMGEYGVILGYGSLFDFDSTFYYKILIDNDVYNYIAEALEKIN